MQTVVVSFPEGKQVNVEIGGFTIRTDQSEKNGGQGSAPEPFDLFLSSLASCAGIYALNFCQARKISSEGIGLEMHCQRDDKSKMITLITFQLTLPATFPEKYRTGIIRAMELCTVKRHMQSAPEFAIEIS